MSSLIETIATRQRAHSAANAAIRPFRVSVPEEWTDKGEGAGLVVQSAAGCRTNCRCSMVDKGSQRVEN